MRLRSIDSPVRIGLVGLGSSGAHHLERISLRSDLRVVAACDSRVENSRSHPLCPNVVPRLSDLLARDDLDYVLIAAPQKIRAELAVRALYEGKHVVVDAPPCADRNEMDAMLAAARSPGRSLSVLPSRREGFDFRAAQQAVSAGTLGKIEAARIVSWGKAVPFVGADLAGNQGPPETAPGDDVFTFFAYQYVDQLLQLVRRPPLTVFARIPEPADADPTATAFFMSMTFDGGGDGLIDVNLHAGAQLHTGWMLAGTTGAYCQQRIHVTEPSGEICDTPIAAADVPQIDIYAELLQSAQSQQNGRESARDAASVMRLIDAARFSSRVAGAVESFDTQG